MRFQIGQGWFIQFCAVANYFPLALASTHLDSLQQRLDFMLDGLRPGRPPDPLFGTIGFKFLALLVVILAFSIITSIALFRIYCIKYKHLSSHLKSIRLRLGFSIHHLSCCLKQHLPIPVLIDCLHWLADHLTSNQTGHQPTRKHIRKRSCQKQKFR